MSSGKKRLDVALAQRGLVASRSQAESYIKLGKVKVNGKILNKSSILVSDDDSLEVRGEERYVSRAALKLDSVARKLKLDFKDRLVLDVGSSTGGFTDYALQHGAARVIAIDVGTDQLHPSLRSDERVELHEKTDIRGFQTEHQPDIILIDVSFISLRYILPAVAKLAGGDTQITAMLKPQFEAGHLPMRRAGQAPSKASRSASASGADSRFSSPVLARSTHRTTRSVPRGENDFGIQPHHQLDKYLNKGVIKNDAIRRKILKDFEQWAKQHFVIIEKADSEVAGAKGNRERFYLLKKI